MPINPAKYVGITSGAAPSGSGGGTPAPSPPPPYMNYVSAGANKLQVPGQDATIFWPLDVEPTQNVSDVRNLTFSEPDRAFFDRATQTQHWILSSGVDYVPIAQDYTIVMIFKDIFNASLKTFFSYVVNTPNTVRIYADLMNDQIKLAGTGGLSVSTTASFSSTDFNEIAFQQEIIGGVAHIRIMHDKQIIASSTATPQANDTDQIFVGSKNTASSERFDGYIGNFTVYNSVKTVSELWE